MMASRNTVNGEPSAGPKVSIAPGNNKLARRLSIGGFPVIEEDDFAKAMGRLTGEVAVEQDEGVRGHDIVAEAEAELLAAYAEGTNRPPMAQEEVPYWRLGKMVDVSAYTREPVQSKPKSHATIEHAIADPNPPPRPGTLAVPPPVEIMSPEGNAVANNRLEKCLLHNDVTTAQKVVSHPTALYELVQEPLFRRACSNTGYEAGSLLPPGKGAFKRDAITGRPRTRQEQEVAAHMWEIARLKHLALIVTEYKQLMADEAAAVRQVRVKERRASMAQFEAQHQAMRQASRDGARHSRGSTIPRPPTSSTASALDSQPTRYLSLYDMGMGMGMGGGQGHSARREEQQQQQQQEEEEEMVGRAGQPQQVHNEQMELTGHGELHGDIQMGSVASMPESVGGDGGEGQGGEGAAHASTPRRPAHGSALEHYSEEVLQEAAAVGLDPSIVHAALEVRAEVMREIDAVEAKAEALIARVTASRSGSRTSSRGAVSMDRSPRSGPQGGSVSTMGSVR